MKIYTALGDQGATDLLGERVSKDDPRIELMGSLDEATSSIGFGRSIVTWQNANDLLISTQRDLYQIMAELAFIDTTRPDSLRFATQRVDWLEATIATVQEMVELPREFVVTGETTAGAALDVARTVVRRAERHAVALSKKGVVGNPEIIRYLNRLSTLLFILARAEDLQKVDHVRLAKGEA
ncbi:MAG TPA: cob(I)yrinic acid a,c-diamide adenosyltransferase [Thermomicrobiales bacterium]|nr:cob(I)yrinic acid a,c-diamide adenosyltransferase [Thermomicrobiales bacterium]